MKINTSRFGELDLDESSTFTFIEPILGYEHLSKFFIVDHMPDSPFKWLQSCEDGKIAFPITAPGNFGLDYQFVIPESDTKKLEISSSENVLTVNIVCIPQGAPEASTINLLGPIIFNLVNKKAIQLVLANSNFSAKQRLFSNTEVKQVDTVNR